MIDRIALVRPADGTVFRTAGRLPERVGDDWPDPADLHAAAGCVPWPIATPVEVSDEPRVTLHVALGEPSLPGAWVPAADLAEHGPDLVRLIAEWTGARPRPVLRADWYRAGWLAEIDAWIDARLAALGRCRAGPSEPVRTWTLSAVLRVPCADGPCYVKASCRHFHAEPAITALVGECAPGDVPDVLAVDTDRAWTLMQPLPGSAPEEDVLAATVAAAAALARVQLASIDRLAVFAAVGCPDRSLPRTADRFEAVLAGSEELVGGGADAVAAVRADLPRLRSVLAELDGCGFPTTLGHGDLHLGNVAWDGSRAILYDWTDACRTHPVLDLRHLTAQVPDDVRTAAVAAYAAAWRERFPAADVDRALALAPTADRLFQAVSYDAIGRSVEPAGRWQLGGTVAGIVGGLAGAGSTG